MGRSVDPPLDREAAERAREERKQKLLEDKECGELVKEYYEHCEEGHLKLDMSVVTSLATGWNIIKASNDFSLHPLIRALESQLKYPSGRKPYSTYCDKVEHFRLKRSQSGNSHLSDANSRHVAELLGWCHNLKTLDLSGAQLSKYGAMEIAPAVAKHDRLETLNLSYNPGISPALTSEVFADALKENTSLQILDVTNSQLGFASVKKLKDALSHSCSHCPRTVEVRDEGNNIFEEVMNAITHGVGVLFSVIGTWVLLYHASAEGQSRITFYACAAYCFCLVLLFTSSTLLHAFFLNERFSVALGLMDHAAIYFLIAGTHMPFCLVGLQDSPHGITMAIVQWFLAAVGIVFCLVDARYPVPFKVPIELTLYLSMGWCMAFVWSDVSPFFSQGALDLLGAGGLAYTGGVVFFIMEKTHHPIGHAIWHVAVLVGAMCHYFAVLLYVVGVENEVAVCSSVSE